jgi:hypothetical protein
MHASHAAVPDAGSNHPLNEKMRMKHMNKLYGHKLASATHFAVLLIQSVQKETKPMENAYIIINHFFSFYFSKHQVKEWCSQFKK